MLGFYLKLSLLIFVSCLAVIMTEQELRTKKNWKKKLAITVAISISWPIYFALFLMIATGYTINAIRIKRNGL